MIRYGDKVIVRDLSEVDGCSGVVYKVVDAQMVHVLLDREVIWPVNISQLELVTPSPESGRQF
ncbi:MAG: hypothetical protein RQ723_10295 [Desulfuromonadales bacterium]|nr:hypothetical protein [Desulfuromonadales bacterium]